MTRPLLLAMALAGCSPPADCDAGLFPFAARSPAEPSAIPVCPWLIDAHGCSTFAEMRTTDEIAAFCAALDGSSLTTDEIAPGEPRADLCYTCD